MHFPIIRPIIHINGHHTTADKEPRHSTVQGTKPEPDPSSRPATEEEPEEGRQKQERRRRNAEEGMRKTAAHAVAIITSYPGTSIKTSLFILMVL